MATAESVVSKYPYLKFLWYLYCFLFTIYWFRHSTIILSKGLSKLTDNGTWQARVGIFFVLGPVIRLKRQTRQFPFLQNPVYFSLMLIFSFAKFILNDAYHAYNYMLTFKTLFVFNNQIKITKLVIFLVSLYYKFSFSIW